MSAHARQHRFTPPAVPSERASPSERMRRRSAETAAECVATIAATMAATGLSRAEYLQKMDAYAEQYGDDPEGGRLFASEMAELSERPRRS